MIRVGTFFISLFFLLLCASCDEHGDNYLDGSLVKNYNISYETVRARLYAADLSVEYLSNEVAALRITIYTDGLILAAGKTYDLLEYGSVTRFEEFGSLPELQSGELTLGTFSETDGSKIAGDFHGVFVTEDGNTLSLQGAFSTTLEVVPQ